MSFEAHGRRHFELVLLDGELPGDGLTSGEKSRELTCVTDKGMAELEQREAERVAKGKKKEKKKESGEKPRELTCVTDKGMAELEQREAERVAKGKKKEKKRERERYIRVPRVTLGEERERRVPRVTLGKERERGGSTCHTGRAGGRKREMRSNRWHRKREEKERGRDKGEA